MREVVSARRRESRVVAREQQQQRQRTCFNALYALLCHLLTLLVILATLEDRVATLLVSWVVGMPVAVNAASVTLATFSTSVVLVVMPLDAVRASFKKLCRVVLWAEEQAGRQAVSCLATHISQDHPCSNHRRPTHKILGADAMTPAPPPMQQDAAAAKKAVATSRRLESGGTAVLRNCPQAQAREATQMSGSTNMKSAMMKPNKAAKPG